MAVLQRSTRVRLPVDRAKHCWMDFAGGAKAAADGVGGDLTGEGPDPGTVYFTKVDDTTTEVTIQVDPVGITDEGATTQHIDSYLKSFERFVENL